MERAYKSCRIQTSYWLDLENDCWVPHADICWEEEGIERRQSLVGPSDRFKLIDLAEIHAIEMAMAWIDGATFLDLTP